MACSAMCCFTSIAYEATAINLFGKATYSLCHKLDAVAFDGEDVEVSGKKVYDDLMTLLMAGSLGLWQSSKKRVKDIFISVWNDSIGICFVVPNIGRIQGEDIFSFFRTNEVKMTTGQQLLVVEDDHNKESATFLPTLEMPALKSR
ncbi:hypothetical protein FEM48_Zijuj02G0189200 [Ziziphus jujuba var. spinosa]|uniref:Uncharacterized protein n=1 Tax=Ziziphus jujuba var. spinosa TaxID=714518 RepID=A0A978VXE1_ZIZJJ|nr:hypothetical protein FEM48_Zijuj02G0189200 [Ziziphus jujuba var. spinosa]